MKEGLHVTVTVRSYGYIAGSIYRYLVAVVCAKAEAYIKRAKKQKEKTRGITLHTKRCTAATKSVSHS